MSHSSPTPAQRSLHRRCVGHITPEALAGGPIGKLIEGDILEILVDRNRLEGRVDLVGHGEEIFGAERGAEILAARPLRPDLAPDAQLPPTPGFGPRCRM